MITIYIILNNVMFIKERDDITPTEKKNETNAYF